MQMIMFVLDDCSQLDAVLGAWRAVGVSGVTIVESIGAYRRQAQGPLQFHYLICDLQE